MDRFVSVHADQATGDVKCDHWHEGSGFLVHHLALSMSLEIGLRAVSTACPPFDKKTAPEFAGHTPTLA
jgi:hypothetical protein